MFDGSDRGRPRGENGSRIEVVGGGLLRITLLFGSAAVAIALLLAPVLEGQTKLARSDATRDIDRIITGSTAGNGHYVLRRSVLQSSPNSICVIRADGSQSGEC